MIDGVRALDVWSVPLHFVGFHESAITELEEEFFGAVRRTTLEAKPAHTYIQTGEGSDWAGIAARHPRHRGGSSGRKRFVDGSEFDAGLQQRDVLCVDPDAGRCYSLDGLACFATSERTWLLGKTSSCFQLLDLVENFLLTNAKRQNMLQCHAAGWVRGGRATLVVGDSGRGKTTQLLQATESGASFLSNDRVFLKCENGLLQARGFPLPMNIGCGTIRSLRLDLPHHDLDDRSKIRLTARDVVERFRPDYEEWYEVAEILVSDQSDLDTNLYWDEDPSHPHWNEVLRSSFDSRAKSTLLTSILARTRTAKLLAIADPR